MYAVMWSEHCSYKSSRAHLGRLPSEAPWVMVGPGENAGVVDCGDGLAVAVRIESHNHPSAIEPYQGAATGVGGILRDIFTMGARPIALLDSLHFGPLDNPRSRWVAEGVVSGISGYGNSVGVPTVGGELDFADCFADNPLVNVMAVGVLRHEHLVLARATGVGNLAVLIGSTTGRDGIGGVSVLASAGFCGDGDGRGADEAKRPSVQVGDPFEEKRLIEACLALYEAGLVAGIQDLGGAGITCATSEIAARGGMGMDVDVRTIPLRMTGMVPAEIMTSESQERMLAIVAPDDLDAVLGLCRRWEVRATVVGTVTDTGRLRILDGPVPTPRCWPTCPPTRSSRARPSTTGPCGSRPTGPSARPTTRPACRRPPAATAGPTCWPCWSTRRSVWSQYDHQLFLNTVEGPGGDATVLRLKAPGPARHRQGPRRQRRQQQPVVRPRPPPGHGPGGGRGRPQPGLRRGPARWPWSTTSTSATPSTPRSCGSCRRRSTGWPRPAWPCRCPVVGGNVSLYNESGGRDIDPTPVVGVVGLIDVLDRRPPGVRLVDGGELLLLARRRPDRAAAWPAPAGPPRRGHRGGELPAARPRGPRPAVRRACGASSPTTCSPASTTSPTAGWRWPWPRWRSPRASASTSPASTVTPPSSPRRRPGSSLCVAGRRAPTPSPTGRRRPASPSPVWAGPAATGWWSTACSTSPSSEATRAWRDALRGRSAQPMADRRG